MDIRKYFPSIDHGLLKGKLRHYIKDQSLLTLLDRIIVSVPETIADQAIFSFPGDDLFTPLERHIGLPIGNLTSQFFANLYLNDLDHFILQELGASAYLRYVDDMVVLGHDKVWLQDIKGRIEMQLQRDRLTLHPKKAHIYQVSRGIDLLGYQVFPFRRRLRSENAWRFQRKLRYLSAAYRAGLLGWDEINPRVRAWIGHACHGETKGLRRAIFAGILFQRG